MGRDTDGNVGSFLSTACPGYRHHIVGGKPLPHTLPPMEHVGDLACTKKEAPRHCPVIQEGGEEDPTAGRRGDAIDYREGLTGIWETVGYGRLVQVPEMGHDGGGQRLVGSGGQLEEVSEDLGTDDTDPETGGGRPSDIYGNYPF